MQEVIKVEQLTKSYGALRAVDGLSLSVERGMVFGLLGANGAGKSTTIECMLGTKKPEKGSVTILGSSPTADRKALFEKTGVQFQESNYQEQIRVADGTVSEAVEKSPCEKFEDAYLWYTDEEETAHENI